MLTKQIAGLICGWLLALVLGLMRLWTRNVPVTGPLPPSNAIVFWSHTRIYLQQIDPIFARGRQLLDYLGDHSFLSYCWYPWQVLQGFFIFRPKVQSANLKPFHQIALYMNEHPDRRVGIMTDSGGPYGQVRRSLVGLSLATGRPLVAAKLSSSGSVRILNHLIPLPLARVRCEFSPPVTAEQLREMGEEPGLAHLQRLFEGTL